VRVLKWIGLVLGALVGLALLAALLLFLLGNSRLSRRYDFPPSNLVIPSDAASIEHGRERTEILCVGCHGEDLGGTQDWLEMGPLGSIDATNLTAGEGGAGRKFASDEDYVRAIRHGIDPDGRPIYMPAVTGMSHLGDQELADIIAYVKSVPPVDRHLEGQRLTPLAKIMGALDLVPAPPVETVSHEVHITAPEPGATTEYGKYLTDVMDCRLCHGSDLDGGRFPDPTVNRLVPSITPRGEVAVWSEEEWIAAFRTGVTPSGHKMDPELMPWEEFGSKVSDEDLIAIYLYVRSLPGR
jgi:mono/diheme cytochrome c family protein